MANDRERTSDGDERREPPDAAHRGDLAGASYGATEREQTEDLRRPDPQADANVADGGVSEVLERESDWPAD